MIIISRLVFSLTKVWGFGKFLKYVAHASIKQDQLFLDLRVMIVKTLFTWKSFFMKTSCYFILGAEAYKHFIFLSNLFLGDILTY